MKTLNILDLEISGCLKRVLEFVPERWSSSQVCTVFYDVVVSIEENKFRLGRKFFGKKEVRYLILKLSS